MENFDLVVEAERGTGRGRLLFEYTGGSSRGSARHFAQLNPSKARELAVYLQEAAAEMEAPVNQPPRFRRAVDVAEGYTT